MVEARFHRELREVAEQQLAQVPGEASAQTDQAGTGNNAIDRQIIEAVLGFSLEDALRALESGEKDQARATRKCAWHGQLAGFALAEKFRGRGVGLQDFFSHYTSVKSNLLDRLYRRQPESTRFRSSFVGLDDFFSGLAAGFVQEWVRAVKTAFRRRQQEAKLHILREKKRYAAVFHLMSEPAFVVDPELNLINVNPSFENFFGISGAEAIGLNCCELIGRNICDVCPLEEILATGGSFSNMEISTSLLAAKGSLAGSVKVLLMAGSALGSRREGNGGAIVVFQDITDRKRTERELEKYRDWLEDLVDARTAELLEANEKLKREIAERRHVEKELIEVTASLKRSNTELEHFAHVVSHDLQEPLMLIASFAERLLARYGSSLDERGRNYLDRIKKGTGKLQRLVGALLQMSRVVTATARFEVLDMNELVRDVVADLEEIINRTGARIEIDALYDVTGDAVQIRQLFQNLISNAIKYHRKNVTPAVSISSRIVGDFCEIFVVDNGIGFGEDDLQRIFEPFVRLRGDDNHEGTGMGLTTCKKIVARHDGEIVARSKPSSGATFIVRLPRDHRSDQHRSPERVKTYPASRP
ncbi:MAG: ATP-binding protein [Desulfobulbales bacterium]|nr:ATP-binding protein [Desulfobulbales bacterium]